MSSDASYASKNSSNDKKNKGNKRCPVFLKKAYHMIENGDSTIVAWCDNGKSFVINDPYALAAKIIPQYFKHNNLQSFVRQLNFYGFRKIKSDKASSELIFSHDQFIQGRPDLLLYIKKTTPQKNAPGKEEKEEIQSLRNEVKNLKKIISNLTNDVGTLKAVAEDLVVKLGECIQRDVCNYDHDINIKKRKLNNHPSASTSPQEGHMPPSNGVAIPHELDPLSIHPRFSEKNKNGMAYESRSLNTEILAEDLCEIDEIWPSSQYSGGYESSLNESEDQNDVAQDLLRLAQRKDHPAQTIPPSISIPRVSDTNTSLDLQIENKIGIEYVWKLNSSIKMLPQEIRPHYKADQLLSKIDDPECLKKQIDDIYDLASEVRKQMREKPNMPESKQYFCPISSYVG